MELLDKTRGPLPGSAANNREFTINYMRKHGFNLREVKSPDYTVVEHKRETVGVVYDDDDDDDDDDEVYIADNYPSLNMGEKSYANTKRTIVKFTNDLKTLEDAIDFLLDSPRRLDRETRDRRVENVRKYFKQKSVWAQVEKVRRLKDHDGRSA